MRSVARLVPALSSARPGAAAAAQGPARRAVATASLDSQAALSELAAKVQAELGSGCSNMTGSGPPFSMFLLRHTNLLAPELREPAITYRHVAAEDRRRYLQQLLEHLQPRLEDVQQRLSGGSSGSLESSSRTAGAAADSMPPVSPPPPPPPQAMPLGASRRRSERAALFRQTAARSAAQLGAKPVAMQPRAAELPAEVAPKAAAAAAGPAAPTAGPAVRSQQFAAAPPLVQQDLDGRALLQPSAAGCWGAPVAALQPGAPLSPNGAAAAAAAGEPPLSAEEWDAALAREWDLPPQQQREQVFRLPAVGALRRPVPVIFDLETTDQYAKTCHITEVAAVCAVTGEALVDALVQLPPGAVVSAGATQATGITTRDCAAHGRPFAEVYASLLQLLQQRVEAAGPGAYLLLIGHNIRAFDLGILHRHAEVAGLPMLRHAHFLDTYALAKQVYPQVDVNDPQLPSDRKLQTLHTFLTGKEAQTAHRGAADCRTNLAVLRQLLGLVAAAGQIPDSGDLHLRLHAAVQLGAGFAGWVATPPATAARPAAKQRRKAARLGAREPSLSEKLARGGECVDDEVAELVAGDGLLDTEGGGQEGDLEARLARVKALSEGWEAVRRDAQLRSSLLTTPLSEVPGRSKHFSAAQIKQLEEAGISTLAQLLECYPSRQISSLAGRLPEHDDEAPSVTLAARVVKRPYIGGAGSSSFYLKSTFKVVHPSEAGIQAPGLPPDAYAHRDCKLMVSEFRRGRGSRFALAKLQEELQEGLAEAGDSDVVFLSGPVALDDGQWGGPDTWKFKKVQVLGRDEAAAVFAAAGQGGSGPMQVVHPGKGGMPPGRMSLLVDKGLALAQDLADKGALQDPLPAWVLAQQGLDGLLPALRAMHRPDSEEAREGGRRRLAFQELLALQLKLLVQRNQAWAGAADKASVQIQGDCELLRLAEEALPFELTGGQQEALQQILAQMADWPPMQCLLQGDVGCGKTIVAFMALLAAAGSGYQGAIMAPTEILAEQHHASLERLVQGITRTAGLSGVAGFRQPRIALLTGSLKGKQRLLVNEQLQRGDIDIVVGTHALISDSTQFARLGLAVVDEQHKFGVEQRGKLLGKAACAPHVLHMTATPIPRTQALIDHGDMAQVLICELPAGRTPVRTVALEDEGPQREQMYQHMREEIARGHGCYIVCPFVEQSDKMAEIKAATEEVERLIAEGVFARQDCGLLHGQMSPAEKDGVLQRFKAGDVKLLVSTTVVEVGVDVPQATVMVIEHAERFGLAQLHQLRGRVGRSARQSHCYLIYAGGAEVQRKMKVLENCSNGFAVAECDLELRGQGEALGTRQSGRNLKSALKAAQIPGDRLLLDAAREAATQLLAQTPDPGQWSAELRALVADDSLLQLDTHSLPTLD